MRKGILKQQRSHKKFVTLVVILITQPKNVKREEEAIHEVDRFRSTRSQKTNNATHVRQSRSLQFPKLNTIH